MIALILLAPFTAVQAKGELIQNIGLMVDGSATLDIDAVARVPFQSVDRTISIGYTKSVIWLRLQIDPAPDGGDVVVIVRPPMLDNVSFFAPSPEAGTAAPPLSAPSYVLVRPDWPSSLRGYRINPPAGGAEYYVRIASTGTLKADVVAKAMPVALRSSITIDFLQISYLVVMLTLLVWSLRVLALTKDLQFVWFASMQALWLIHNIIYFGYASAQTLNVEAETLALVFRTLVIMASIASVAFHRAVLIRFRPAVLAVRLLDLQLAGMFAAFVLFWTVDRQFALQLNAYCVVATPFILVLNAFTAREEASPGLKAMRILYGMLSATLFVWVFSLVGYSKVPLLPLYGSLIHGLATGILMFTMLHLHVRGLFATAEQAEAKIAFADRQHALQQERTRALAQFLDMLTHEARNALAVIQMSISQATTSALQRARASEAILGLTEVIDRCNQTIRIDNTDQEIRIQAVNLEEILQRLCNNHPDSVHLNACPIFLQSDPVLLGVVFSNLIDNARKYSPSGSAVTVAMTPTPDGVSVVVENEHGRYGYPDPSKVFDKYYRNQLAKAMVGSGLGLYIARGLLELLGGTIAYEPTEERVRFKVSLPC
jgi:signal transduction histidine kinase